MYVYNKMNNKEYTNKQLKLLILDIYKTNNIKLDEKLEKQLNVSSKTKYNILHKLYSEIKYNILDKIIDNEKQLKNEIQASPIIIEKKEIEIQTDIIKDDIYYNEIKQLKTDIFNKNNELNNLKYKIKNYKKIIKSMNKKCNSNESSNDNSDDEINEIKEKRLPYCKILEYSSKNIIQELSKLSRHQLKQLYNRYFSKKLDSLLFNPFTLKVDNF